MARLIYPALQQPIPVTDEQGRLTAWHRPLSEPVRVKRRLHASLNLFDAVDPDWLPNPITFVMWWSPYSEPVRFKKGLRAPYHEPFFAPPRIVLAPDVTATLTATETSLDSIIAGVALDPQPPLPSQEGASVLIVEVPVLSDGALSIRGT